MDIKEVEDGPSHGNWVTILCIDDKCHLECTIFDHFEEHKPDRSSWTVEPCDGSCPKKMDAYDKKLPKLMMADVIAFLADGRPRHGRYDGNIFCTKKRRY